MVTTTPRPSNRTYKRNQRHANFAQFRNSKQEKEFLRVQAARLSTTQAVLFAKLNKYTAERIVAATNLAAIP